jgi:serine/threonine-protein kinase RsbW
MIPNGTPHSIELTIPPKAEFLVFCRLVLAGLARVREIDEEALSDLKLAVTEACSNSIRHAYRDGGDGAVGVHYELGSDYLAVEVVDEGSGFKLESAVVSPEELQEEGMGISIIRAVMDELELGTGPGGRGSRVRFTKYLAY